MAQFRVEFVLDQASGKYRAELYHPERQDELLVRTQAVYPTQEAAVLGVVQLFKGALPKPPRKKKAAKRPHKAKRKQTKTGKRRR